VTAQKVVSIISGDKAKLQTYCAMTKLAKQMDQAYEKKDDKMADELSQKIDTIGKTLGSEYAALIEGLQDGQLGAEFMSAVAAASAITGVATVPRTIVVAVVVVTVAECHAPNGGINSDLCGRGTNRHGDCDTGSRQQTKHNGAHESLLWTLRYA
jgi:hypothetical protein